MKLKPFALLAAFILSVNFCNAAFPVKNEPTAAAYELAANNLRDGIIETHFGSRESYAPAAPAVNNAQQGSSGFGIASLACGVTGLIVAGIPLGIAAIVFGAIGMSPNRSMRGLAVAGLILGIIDVVAVAAFLATQ